MDTLVAIYSKVQAEWTKSREQSSGTHEGKQSSSRSARKSGGSTSPQTAFRFRHVFCCIF